MRNKIQIKPVNNIILKILKNITCILYFISFYGLSQIDTLYVKFDVQNINKQGYFKNEIVYNKHRFKKKVFELRYKCNFNKIKIDSTQLEEQQVINEASYMRIQNFYFSKLIHLDKELNKKAFVQFLEGLKDDQEWAKSFDLYKIVSKEELSKLSVNELYEKTKFTVDSLHEKNGKGYYGATIYKSTFLKRIYSKDFKLIKQTIINKKDLNENNFIDLTKQIETSADFIALFNKIKEGRVIFLTTSYNLDNEFILFNEVFFNEQTIKIQY